VRAHLRPVARVGEGAALARHGASAMMVVSDGLAKDLDRLARASGVGVRVRLADVPIAAGASLQEALSGGEDYELVATLRGPGSLASASDELRDAFGTRLTVIGEVMPGSGLGAVDAEGVERALPARGWDHFA
jgi:thiamine-monophosphate kinase